MSTLGILAALKEATPRERRRAGGGGRGAGGAGKAAERSAEAKHVDDAITFIESAGKGGARKLTGKCISKYCRRPHKKKLGGRGCARDPNWHGSIDKETWNIWEFIESAEAVRIVDQFYSAGKPAHEAAKMLILKAAVRWAQKEGPTRDDITAIVVYLSGTAESLESRGTASTVTRDMLVDTVGDGRADAKLVDTTGDGRPDKIVYLAKGAAPTPAS